MATHAVFPATDQSDVHPNVSQDDGVTTVWPKGHDDDLVPLGDLVTFSEAALVLNVVQGGILPVVTLCGVITNVINMAVFLRQGLSDRINLLLFSVAVADTGYIANSMLYRLPTLLTMLDPALGHFWKWKINRQQFIGIKMGFHSSSSCLTLLISLERCVCVLWPLKAKTLLSTRRMAVVVASIFAVCLGFCALMCFRFHTLTHLDPLTNTTVHYIANTRFFLENSALVVFTFDGIFTFTLPTVCVGGVMLSTILIALRMRAVLSWRLKTAHAGGGEKTMTSSENVVTRMLLVVCVMFTVCTTPSVTHAFFRFYMPGFELGARYHNTFNVTVCLVHAMAAINSSANFLVYYRMSSKFKDTLLRHFLPCVPTLQQ